MLCVGHDLGTEKGENVVGNSLYALESKVGVVNSKVSVDQEESERKVVSYRCAVLRPEGAVGGNLLVEPIDLGGDEMRRHEAFAGKELLDLSSLVGLALEDGVSVAGIVGNDVVDGSVRASWLGRATWLGRAVGGKKGRLDFGNVFQGRSLSI